MSAMIKKFLFFLILTQLFNQVLLAEKVKVFEFTEDELKQLKTKIHKIIELQFGCLKYLLYITHSYKIKLKVIIWI